MNPGLSPFSSQDLLGCSIPTALIFIPVISPFLYNPSEPNSSKELSPNTILPHQLKGLPMMFMLPNPMDTSLSSSYLTSAMGNYRFWLSHINFPSLSESIDVLFGDLPLPHWLCSWRDCRLRCSFLPWSNCWTHDPCWTNQTLFLRIRTLKEGTKDWKLLQQAIHSSNTVSNLPWGCSYPCLLWSQGLPHFLWSCELPTSLL